MAAYYILQRPSPVSRASSLATEGNGTTDAQEDATPLNTISADHSIYIFPNPPSAPPSPLSPGSSLFSVPTDFEPSEPSSHDARSRTLSNLTDVAASAPDGGVEVARQVSLDGENEIEIDVELWELSTDPDHAAETSDTDESWVLEEQVQRINAEAIDVSFVSPSHTPFRARKLSAPQSPNTAAKHYWVLRPQRRPRSHSRVRTVSSISSFAPPSARRSAPHPRIHIPLLSFFASLLSVDLDDPALRLLTHADPGDAETVLFPGHTAAQLLSRGRLHERDPNRDREADADTDVSGLDTEEEPHGLPKLLLASLSDHSTVALRSLRAGLAVCASHTPDSSLPIPGAQGLLGLWRVVEEVCARSSQAWKEVWGGSSEPDAGPS
ncbi:hypothetical protein BD309DRAFT_954298 [Dichomitus squalens]|uniref:Uncharacterized protein n=1 Tax=Dichomitus squalens TaxID=114155 RepID=A0A4Q9Q5I3_9APHY|nr:hypothetical protein BD309DRAFT_954298 [Dichomitus squalens]TBU62271.1 hypothetical protein BD310DRAFT_919036 [Dichomitus squalens]